MEKKLVPVGATEFPGSFAPELRGDHRKHPGTREWRSTVYAYFTDGWDDVNMWKSAVCICHLCTFVDS